MELRRYWGVLRQWWWLVVLGTCLAGGAAFTVSKLMTPIYSATVKLMINQSTNDTLVTDINSLNTSQQLANTYVELLKTEPILSRAIRKFNLDKKPEEFIKDVNVTILRSTSLIVLKVENPSPTLAQAIANELASALIDTIEKNQNARFGSSIERLGSELDNLQSEMTTAQGKLTEARSANPPNLADVARFESAVLQYQTNYSNLLKSYEDLRTAQARLTNNINIVETLTPDKPVRPTTGTNTLLATVVGAMLALGIIFLIEYLDNTVKRSDDLDALGLAGVGTVGRIMLQVATDKLVVAHDPRSPIAEGFRAMRTNIQFSSVDHPVRVLLVTSSGPGEGKTTIAANLAVALAQAGQKVALVDADLRRPSVHKILGMTNNSGLTNVLLQGGETLDQVLKPSGIENLKVMTSGPVPPNPAELLGSERIGKILEELKGKVDWVILDTPPCLVVTDAVVLAKRADGVLLVVRVGTTRREALQESVVALQQIGVKVVGAVMNHVSARRSAYRYDSYNSRYYYYDSNSTGEGAKRHRAKSGVGHGLFNLLGRKNGSAPKSVSVSSLSHPVANPPHQGPE